MPSLIIRFYITLIISTLISLPALAHSPVAQITAESSLAPMLKKVTPAIVNIAVEKVVETKLNQLLPTSNDNNTRIPVKMMMVGSGIIFDAKHGYIVTNAHVIKDQKVIVATLKNGEKYYATLLAKSKKYDIAVLQIHAKHLDALDFGNSNKLQVGDFVTAIGSPFGLEQTVTSGVVSALNRSHPKIEGYQSFIQTDAPINPGNSGGALVNMQGKLIGINTAIIAPTAGNTGIGFAIPSNMAKAVISQLLKYGKVERGVLGVIVQKLTPSLANAMALSGHTGAVVTQVLPNSPADDSGIKSGDLITQIDKTNIRGAEQLQNTVGLIKPDTSINMTVIRDHQSRIIEATIGRPKDLKTQIMPYFSGMRLQDFKELESDGTAISGLIIAKVSDHSQGALSGLRPGDIITEINQKPIHSLQLLKKIVHEHHKPLLLTVLRGHMSAFIVIRAQ